MFQPKFGVILSNVGACCDRFLSEGYSEPLALEAMFDRVASIEGVRGVELVADWHVRSDNVGRVGENLERTGLKLISVIPDHFGQRRWGRGAFTSKDPRVRARAVEHTCEMMDVAAVLGCDTVNLWPGQDGYDYCFQADYIEERGWFEEGLRRCCAHNAGVRVSVEYKPKEPRNRSYPSNVYSTLLMVQASGAANCGVTIDYGHALVAYENTAESAAVLKKYGDRLFHVHMNDNYGYWDDDMIAGSVHTVSCLEFLYWLGRTGYAGWISMDQYPYREDGRDAVCESVRWLMALCEILNEMDGAEVCEVIRSGDAVRSSAMLRKCLLGR